MDGHLRDVVDVAWAEALDCDRRLVRTPGVHLVRGGPGFAGYNAVYMARIEDAVLVYCPESFRAVARDLLAGCQADDAFTVGALEGIARDRLEMILGPSSHAFTDRRHFAPVPPAGRQVSANDERLAALRAACGEDEWAEAGFIFGQGVVYAMETDGDVLAAGNMTPFRGRLADVGLITHPDHRGEGWAKRLASQMVVDALPDAGVVRYRALTTNAPSLAVARALGFIWRGLNLVARLREPAVDAW